MCDSSGNAKWLRSENASLRQELMQYRSQIFQLQLVAPAVAILIIQHLSSETHLRVLVPIAATGLLLLSLYVLNRLHRAMIQQVGYLLHVIKSPWEERLARFREQEGEGSNPASGRLGIPSFWTHTAIIVLAQISGCWAAIEQTWCWLWLIVLQLVVVLYLLLQIGKGFWGLKGYVTDVDERWTTLAQQEDKDGDSERSDD